MMAAIGGNARLVELLFDHRCLPDATTSDGGCSALYMAASRGHQKVVDILVSQSTRIDQVDNANLTPLMAALSQQKFDVVRALLAAGADVKRVDASGATLMDYAKAFSCPPDVMSTFEERGVKVSGQDLRNSGGGCKWDGYARIRWEKKSEAQ